MSKLEAIIEKANKKEIKMVSCKSCRGTGRKDCYDYIANGKCFRCNGSGYVLNKWGKIKKQAEWLIEGIEYTKKELDKCASESVRNRRAEQARNCYIADIKILCAKAGI